MISCLKLFKIALLSTFVISFFTIPEKTLAQYPTPGWYAPDGSACNRTNYNAYYALPSCTGKAGFVTEGISPQGQCSPNGSGKCYLATGNPFIQPAKSLYKLDTSACTPIAPAVIPSNAFDTLFPCRFGLPPSQKIDGTVTADFIDKNQFEKILTWIVDSQVGYTNSCQLDKKQLVSLQPMPFIFNNLFPDKKYDVYVKAYGTGGVFLDKVIYEGSCGSPGCRSYPGVSFNFKLTFPKPLVGSLTNKIPNEAFQKMIDQWINGQISPLQMSLFINSVARVPGLQKSTYDPKFPGGCKVNI